MSPNKAPGENDRRHEPTCGYNPAMIPPFNDEGYLPPGIHAATLEEIASRFGEDSELRRVQMDSVHWLVELARRAGVLRIVVNGSFVTDKLEPNDVDCVLLFDPQLTGDPAVDELLAGLPFINMELVDEDGFRQYTERTFASDRDMIPKGMIEVVP